MADLPPVDASGQIVRVGKGTAQTLPNRATLNSLTQGDPYQRSLGNYAKATPGPSNVSPGIFSMGKQSG